MTRPTLRSCLLAAALASAVGLAGCESSQKASSGSSSIAMGAINDTCPMSGKAIDDKTTATYKGNEIGFCCPACTQGWNAMTTQEKDDYLAQHLKSKSTK